MWQDRLDTRLTCEMPLLKSESPEETFHFYTDIPAFQGRQSWPQLSPGQGRVPFSQTHLLNFPVPDVAETVTETWKTYKKEFKKCKIHKGSKNQQ